MALLHRHRLAPRAVDAQFWPEVARLTQAWLNGQGVAVADAIVLLPYAELLPHARLAFAGQAGWQPRIETTQTLTASLPPGPSGAEGMLALDVARDRLLLAAAWDSQTWSADWRDRQGQRQAIAAVVDLAHDLVRASRTLTPAQRDAYWANAQALLPLSSGPGALERRLARWAVELAQGAPAPHSDALFTLRPSAWVWLQCGGEDRLIETLTQNGNEVPALCWNADDPGDTPFDAGGNPPQRWVCADFEQEAQACAQQVSSDVEQGRSPVALIALDRLLVRRVRALLARDVTLRVHDETGWTLSTTRAGARVMSSARAARPQATRDEQLEALKLAAADAADEAASLDVLECAWRRRRTPSDAATGAWEMGLARLAPLHSPQRRPLSAWQQTMSDVLTSQGLRDDAADPAVQAVLTVLRPKPSSAGAAADGLLDLDGFIDWLDDALEAGRFVPDRGGGAPDVIITPLARAMLRPFGSAVCAGADELRLGRRAPPRPLVPAHALAALALASVEQQASREALAFAQILRLPTLLLLRRAADAGEALAPSALVERAVLAATRAGRAWPAEVQAQLAARSVTCAAQTRPAPALGALPKRLSVSQIEQLRDCPYRFFAMTILGLQRAEEIEREFGPSDWGQWLHDVLHRFHERRATDPQPDADRALLDDCAAQVSAESGQDVATLLPWHSAFELLAPAYLDWQRKRDATGWRYAQGELSVVAEVQEWALSVKGRLDRIDSAQDALQVIDYKTGDVSKLKDKVKHPLEDTQLALYGLLAQAAGEVRGRDLRASYLRLGEREMPSEHKHADLAATIEHTRTGLAADFAMIRAGVGLRAIGEEPVCNWCEARGLCRRDHWDKMA